MPKVTCNGFSMFAQHARQRLEAERGRRFHGMQQELIDAATPLWNRLSAEQKLEWKARAKTYKRTDEFMERKKAARGRRSPQRQLSAAASVGRGPSGWAAVDTSMNAGGRQQQQQAANGGARHSKNSAAAAADDEQYYPDGDDDNWDECEIGVPVAAVVRAGNAPADGGGAEQSDVDVWSAAAMEHQRRGEHQRQQQRVALAQPQSGAGADLADAKRAADRASIEHYLAVVCRGNLDTIKRCRFVFVSVQTYGQLEGDVCPPAELAIYEFSLRYGIMDTYTAIVGPWPMGDMERQRAALVAHKTHKVSAERSAPNADEYVPQATAVLRELLGRLEPALAVENGVAVGLYKNGLAGADAHTTVHSRAGYTANSGGAPSLTDWPLLPGDTHGRRWIVCLPSEQEAIAAAVRYMAEREGIAYSGFPLQPGRYVHLDVLVETLAAFRAAQPAPDYKAHVRALSTPHSKSMATYWDRRAEMYCSVHAATLNKHCATAAACKSCFALFHALRLVYALPFNDYRAE